MKSNAKSPFDSAWLFALKRRIAHEIRSRIAPHVRREADHGYPFRDADGLWQAAMHGGLDTELHLRMIEKGAERMGKGFGDAFKYIVYRDLNQRLAMYEELAWQGEQSPAVSEPRLIAKPA